MPGSSCAKTPRTDHSAIPNIRSAKGSGIKFLLPPPQANDFPAQVFIARQGFFFPGGKSGSRTGILQPLYRRKSLGRFHLQAQVEKTFRKGGKKPSFGIFRSAITTQRNERTAEVDPAGFPRPQVHGYRDDRSQKRTGQHVGEEMLHQIDAAVRYG